MIGKIGTILRKENMNISFISIGQMLYGLDANSSIRTNIVFHKRTKYQYSLMK